MSSKPSGSGRGETDKRQRSIDSFAQGKRQKADDDQSAFDEVFGGRVSRRRGLATFREEKAEVVSQFEDEQLTQEEKDEMQRVIEMSKQQAVEDEKRRGRWKTAQRNHGTVPEEQRQREACEANQSVNNGDKSDEDIFGSPSLFPSQECHNGKDDDDDDEDFRNPFTINEQSTPVKGQAKPSKGKTVSSMLKKKLSLRKNKVVQEDPNFLVDPRTMKEEKSPPKRKATENIKLKPYKIPKLSERRSSRLQNVREVVETEKTTDSDRVTEMNLGDTAATKEGDFWDQLDENVLLLKRFKEEDLKRSWTLAEAEKAALFFAPHGVNHVQYAEVIEAMFEKYRIDLFLAQSKALELIPWSQGITCGRTEDGSLNAWRSSEKVQRVRPQLVVPGAKSETDHIPALKRRRSSSTYNVNNKEKETARQSESQQSDTATVHLSIEVDSDEEVAAPHKTDITSTESSKTTFSKIKDAGVRLWRSIGAMSACKTENENENLQQEKKETLSGASGSHSADDASQVVSRGKKAKLKILESSDEEEEDEVKFNLILPELGSPQGNQEQLSPTVVGRNSKPQSQEGEMLNTSSDTTASLGDISSDNASVQPRVVHPYASRRQSLRRMVKKPDYREMAQEDEEHVTSQHSQPVTTNGHHLRDELVDLTSTDNEEVDTTPAQDNVLQCPMCFKNFPADVVADHAAVCDGPPPARTLRSERGGATGQERATRPDKENLYESARDSRRQEEVSTSQQDDVGEEPQQNSLRSRIQNARRIVEHNKEEMNELRAQSAAFATVPSCPFTMDLPAQLEENAKKVEEKSVKTDLQCVKDLKVLLKESPKAKMLVQEKKQKNVVLSKVPRKLDLVKIGNARFNVSKLKKGSFSEHSNKEQDLEKEQTDRTMKQTHSEQASKDKKKDLSNCANASVFYKRDKSEKSSANSATSLADGVPKQTHKDVSCDEAKMEKNHASASGKPKSNSTLFDFLPLNTKKCTKSSPTHRKTPPKTDSSDADSECSDGSDLPSGIFQYASLSHASDSDEAMDVLGKNYKKGKSVRKSYSKVILDSQDAEQLLQSYANKVPIASTKTPLRGDTKKVTGKQKSETGDKKKRKRADKSSSDGEGELCFICNKVFPKHVIQQHVNEELDKQKREMEGMETEEQGYSSGPSTSHKRPRRKSPASKIDAGLFMALDNLSDDDDDDDGDQFQKRPPKRKSQAVDSQQSQSDVQFEVDSDELTDSPVKTFKPINALGGGGFIDYKNQFRNKRKSTDDWQFIVGDTNKGRGAGFNRGRGAGSQGGRGSYRGKRRRRGRGKPKYYRKKQ